MMKLFIVPCEIFLLNSHSAYCFACSAWLIAWASSIFSGSKYMPIDLVVKLRSFIYLSIGVFEMFLFIFSFSSMP